jgi:hypothetical protein
MKRRFDTPNILIIKLNSFARQYIATKANGYLVRNGTSDPTILFISQTVT